MRNSNKFVDTWCEMEIRASQLEDHEVSKQSKREVLKSLAAKVWDKAKDAFPHPEDFSPPRPIRGKSHTEPPAGEVSTTPPKHNVVNQLLGRSSSLGKELMDWGSHITEGIKENLNTFPTAGPSLPSGAALGQLPDLPALLAGRPGGFRDASKRYLSDLLNGDERQSHASPPRHAASPGAEPPAGPCSPRGPPPLAFTLFEAEDEDFVVVERAVAPSLSVVGDVVHVSLEVYPEGEQGVVPPPEEAGAPRDAEDAGEPSGAQDTSSLLDDAPDREAEAEANAAVEAEAEAEEQSEMPVEVPTGWAYVKGVAEIGERVQIVGGKMRGECGIVVNRNGRLYRVHVDNVDKALWFRDTEMQRLEKDNSVADV